MKLDFFEMRKLYSFFNEIKNHIMHRLTLFMAQLRWQFSQDAVTLRNCEI